MKVFIQNSFQHNNKILKLQNIKWRDDMKYLYDDVVLRHTIPIFMGLGRCPIVNWDFAGAVSIFEPDTVPVVHQ